MLDGRLSLHHSERRTSRHSKLRQACSLSAAYREGKDGSELRAAVGTDSRATSSLDIKGHLHGVKPDVVLLCAGSVCGHCHSGCVPVCAGGGNGAMEPDGAKAARHTLFRQLELYLVKQCVPGCFQYRTAGQLHLLP